MNSIKFSATGANTVILRVLQKHMTTVKVITTGFDALISLIEVSRTGESHGQSHSSSASKRSQQSNRNTDESGFDIVSKILRSNGQNKEISVSGIRLIHLLLLSFVSYGSGTRMIDSLSEGVGTSGGSDGKMISLSSKSIQIIGEIVQRGLTFYADNLRLVRYCFLIISELSVEPANSAYLGSIGLCHLVVQTIESLLFNLSSVDSSLKPTEPCHL